ncbi:vWA domain-containing protein [Pseudonocardia parietis]|uniref:Ca-activated chloride channel family protein n=1 Tax=Pseudonocardia parietis TaxID=570936 RepID=A0ABS4W381_9PSEU|nr:VWA domain-containing protein [Pseudonocardia parietis]MBP2370639.1 Ca-activated chloride channel family protein [Pseudonocardia parietis]
MNSREPRRAGLRALLLIVLVSVLGMAPVSVAGAQEPPAPGSPDPGPEFAPTMVVLDESGSMTGPDPSGGTKMQAAQQAVRTMIDATPDAAPVGLAVYGTSTGNSEAERAQGCEDVTVLQPPSALDRAAITGAVDSVTPRGYTPIGRSLQVAAEELPQEGPRSIVLVSDGEDTCAPPEPCEVVRELAGQGLDLVVHAVGFGVDDTARAQLSCVAQTTGGTYTDALDGEALSQVLPRITATALRNYEPTGTPITGGPTVEAAPVAAPGQHLDTIGQKETRYYSVDVPAGATAYFTATVTYPRVPGVGVLDDFNALNLRTYGEAGEDCNEFEAAQQSRSSDGATLTVSTTWTGAAEERTGGGADRCKGPGRYVFGLVWNRVSEGVPARLPVELLVGVEQPVTEPGPVAVLPAPTLAGTDAAPVPAAGGGSFATAGVLDGSGSYTDTLQRGEFVFYRVRLDWGRSLAYRVRFAETPGRGLANLSPVHTTLYAPTREEIDDATFPYSGRNVVLPTHDPALTTVPVRYLNRDADVLAARSQSLPGWYYIGVQVSPPHEEDSRTAAPIPVRIDLTVSGATEPGPVYATTAGATPFESAAVAEGGPPAGVDSDDAGPGFPGTPVVVAGLVLLAVGTGGALVLRRRRRG